MAARHQFVLAQRQSVAQGEVDLLPNEVDPVDLLGHRVLHLQAGVHFEKIEGPVGIEEELDRPDRVVAGCPDDGHRSLAEAPPQIRIDNRRRTLLHHLLVPPLNRTLPFSDVDGIAVTVRHDLHLDVAGAG